MCRSIMHVPNRECECWMQLSPQHVEPMKLCLAHDGCSHVMYD